MVIATIDQIFIYQHHLKYGCKCLSPCVAYKAEPHFRYFCRLNRWPARPSVDGRIWQASLAYKIDNDGKPIRGSDSTYKASEVFLESQLKICRLKYDYLDIQRQPLAEKLQRATLLQHTAALWLAKPKPTSAAMAEIVEIATMQMKILQRKASKTAADTQLELLKIEMALVGLAAQIAEIKKQIQNL
jgi:hypothetical protein